MLIRGTDLHMIRGDSETLVIKIEGQDGIPYQLQEGDKVYFTVKIRANTKEKAIQKIITYFPNNQAIVELEPKDTSNLNFRKYVYDIQLTQANGRVKTIIPLSTFEIMEEVTYE